MNYLSHFIFNHRVMEMPEDPHFAMGVALPDLWPRFSRKRRLRWKAVRSTEFDESPSRQLQHGLINHVDVDKRFHTLPCFINWQHELKSGIDADGIHPMTIEFVAHLMVEMVLDQILLQREPDLADYFYDTLAQTDPLETAQRVGTIGNVDTHGLEDTIDLFVKRRFLKRYATDEGVLHAIGLVINFAKIPNPPDETLVRTMHRRALQCAEPEVVWPALKS